MAITKEIEVKRIEVVGKWSIGVATDQIIKENNVEISRTRHRHVVNPFISTYLSETVDSIERPALDSDGNRQWTHTPFDISGEDKRVQSICNTVWTTEIKNEFKSFVESDIREI